MINCASKSNEDIPTDLHHRYLPEHDVRLRLTKHVPLFQVWFTFRRQSTHELYCTLRRKALPNFFTTGRTSIPVHPRYHHHHDSLHHSFTSDR
jgi:hypothetical protein